jgi:hypothetical protein
MQCQRCQFENMPGQERCFKCSSVLEGQAVIRGIEPPRMAGWKRPWRKISRLLRGHGKQVAQDSTEQTDTLPDYSEKMWVLFPGIMPGLGHLLTGRFRSIFWIVGLWCVFMALAAVLFYTPWGWVCLGMAAGIHAWLMCDTGLLTLLDDIGERIIAVLVVFVLLVLGYVGLSLNLGMSFQRTPLVIEAADIRYGDLLLMEPIEDRSALLERGTIVAFGAHSAGNAGTQTAVGQIVGLPHETVTVFRGRYAINGVPLDEASFPMPTWLRDLKRQITIDPNTYFVSSEYHVQGRRGELENMIARMCLIPVEDIEAQATMMWWPLSRRHYIGSLNQED